MREYTTQICVIAAGPAGLAAAAQAAEDGAKVIVLEKMKRAGGTANAGMGILGIGTHYQKAQMYDISVEKSFKMYMEYTHYNVDARLIRRYFEQSSETIEWLEDMGVEFEGAFKYFPQSEPTWHIVKCPRGIGAGAAQTMNQKIYEHCVELGVEFLFETAAKKLIKEDGHINGVIGETKAGEEFTVHCQAAVLAAGGASGDFDMVYEETGFTPKKDMFNFVTKSCSGDGLRMAWEAGADHVPVRIEQAAAIEGISGLPNAVMNIFFQPNLLVNLHGKRFVNEEDMQNTTYLSNAVAHQKHKMGIMIVDTSIVEHYIENGVDVISFVRPDPDVSAFPAAVEKAKKVGTKGLYIADTIKELAEQLGIDPQALSETVEEYNDFCDGTDEEFYKSPKYMRKLEKGPFYAARVRPGGYGTVGGIRINENCEACDREFLPVPGLYAAGADACNIYDDSYMFLLPGNSMGFALNTGRIAGMSAAELVSE